MSFETAFPRTLKAGKRADVSQWELADALLAETDGKDTGPQGFKAVCADFERLLGLDYTVQYLRTLRFVAERFPKAKRYDGEHNKPVVTLRGHEEAGNPEMLEMLVKEAKRQGKVVTRPFILKTVNVFYREQREEREAAHREAQRERANAEREQAAAARRLKQAKTDAEREAARRHHEQATERKQGAQKKVLQTRSIRRNLQPVEDDTSSLVVRTGLNTNLTSIRALVKDSKKLAKSANELSPKSRAALAELTMEVINELRELHGLLRVEQGNRQFLQVAV